MIAGEPQTAADGSSLLELYLDDARLQILDEIRQLTPADGRHTGGLYSLLLDYPLRPAKGLRPALCIAVCRSLGGHLESILPTAAALELYHNAFLLHDDVEDGSEKRRREWTLHRLHGPAIAINVGDAMLALAMRPLLDNTRLLGLGRALRILDIVVRMARESAEGQMIELGWIRSGRWTISDRAYRRMVYKKTAWYSFIAPVLVGALAAGADAASIPERLVRFATLLGIAFQIQDDVLNLVGEGTEYGKEIDGDLWEGKHTLILVHAVREASEAERRRALAILAKRRPRAEESAAEPLDRLGWDVRTQEDVQFLRDLCLRAGSIEYAWRAAHDLAARARRTFEAVQRELAPSVHRRFLEELTSYVVQRRR